MMSTSPSATQGHLTHRHLGPCNPGRAWSPPDWSVAGIKSGECVAYSREPHAHGAHKSPSFTAVSPRQSTQPTSAAVRCGLSSRSRRWFGGAGRNVGMQSLQDKASEWSGVAAADAFAIDDGNIFESLGGTPQPFVDLSTNFYSRSVRPSVRPSATCPSLPPFFSSALNQSDLECSRSCPVEFPVSWPCLD